MLNKTILIAAGGTGGHLYPAIAVADEIRRERPDVRVIFAGTSHRIESKEVPRAGYPFYPISMEASYGSLRSLVSFPIKFGKATLDVMRLISKERPAAMLGGGAYLTVPAGIAAWSFHVPIALLEINSIAGTANKILARLADKLFIAYPESRSQFPKRISESAIVSGTPVRADLGRTAGETGGVAQEEGRTSFGLDPARRTILVFGGSLGARPINEAMENIAAQLSARDFNVLWQTGKSANVSELQSKFLNVPNVHVTEYIYDMERAYAAADLVVCRAGASSLAELARLGKPAVLIPWSGAAANHQEANARSFEQAGAAYVVTDAEVKAKLFETVLELLNGGDRLRQFSEAMKQRDNPNAASVVARWLIERIP